MAMEGWEYVDRTKFKYVLPEPQGEPYPIFNLPNPPTSPLKLVTISHIIL